MQNIVNKLERKFGRYSIPELTKKIVILKAIVGITILLDSTKIKSFFSTDIIPSQIIMNFFTPIIVPPFDLRGTELSPFWLVLGLLVFYQFGSILEKVWGTFRYNLFIVSIVLLSFFYSFFISFFLPEVFQTPYFIGDTLYLFVFLAFSMRFPEQTILFFFVIPMKIKYLGIFIGVGYTYFITFHFFNWGLYSYAGYSIFIALPIIFLLINKIRYR